MKIYHRIHQNSNETIYKTGNIKEPAREYEQVAEKKLVKEKTVFFLYRRNKRRSTKIIIVSLTCHEKGIAGIQEY